MSRYAQSGLSGLWRLLSKNADYRRLFFATVVSFLGDWFAFVAVSGFVTDVTGRPGLAAVVYACSVLPVFLLSPVAGMIADRIDRKRLLITADLLRVLPALGLLGALALGSAPLAILCVLLLAALSTFFEPIAAAVVPNLVAPEDLSVGQAALSGVWGTMLFVGAALGGVISASLGREASILFNALTFLVSAFLVAGIRRPMQERLGLASYQGLAQLWNLARQSQVTRSLLFTKAGVGLANGIIGLLPAYAVTRFGGGDAGVGALLAARGLGALVGPFVGHWLVRGDGRRLFLVCGGAILLYGAAYVFLPLAASLPWAVVCIMLAHLGGGAQWVLSTFGLQVSTPDALRGRVLSLDFGLATLSIGVSSLAAGGAAEVVGLDAASRTLAVVALIYGVSWLLWTRRLWRGQRDPLRHFQRSMRVLVAPQELKGTLTAAEAAQAIATGLRAARPEWSLDLASLADGGPGTVDVLVFAKQGERRRTRVHDPLGRPLDASWGLIDGGEAAVIEMAAASGLSSTKENERDPLRANTFGTGELIRAALDAGCRRIFLGAGGSATTDGGMGAACALGVRFLDAQGGPLPPEPRALQHLAAVDVRERDPRLEGVELTVLADVQNPLLGKEGAAHVYGPQKGATPEQVNELEALLTHLVRVARQTSLAQQPATGAAGGLPFALAAFCGASIRPGFDVVAEALQLEKRVKDADLVITGEGRLDAQTSYLKGPYALARLAKGQHKRVVLFAGTVAKPAQAMEVFDEVHAVTPEQLTPGEIKARAGELLKAAVEKWASSSHQA
ncbi:MAG: glycerate kinase [Myxococcota bacterium]